MYAYNTRDEVERERKMTDRQLNLKIKLKEESWAEKFDPEIVEDEEDKSLDESRNEIFKRKNYI